MQQNGSKRQLILRQHHNSHYSQQLTLFNTTKRHHSQSTRPLFLIVSPSHIPYSVLRHCGINDIGPLAPHACLPALAKWHCYSPRFISDRLSDLSSH